MRQAKVICRVCVNVSGSVTFYLNFFRQSQQDHGQVYHDCSEYTLYSKMLASAVTLKTSFFIQVTMFHHQTGCEKREILSQEVIIHSNTIISCFTHLFVMSSMLINTTREYRHIPALKYFFQRLKNYDNVTLC